MDLKVAEWHVWQITIFYFMKCKTVNSEVWRRGIWDPTKIQKAAKTMAATTTIVSSSSSSLISSVVRPTSSSSSSTLSLRKLTPLPSSSYSTSSFTSHPQNAAFRRPQKLTSLTTPFAAAALPFDVSPPPIDHDLLVRVICENYAFSTFMLHLCSTIWLNWEYLCFAQFHVNM